jgi:hypothetical protein
MSAFPSTIIRLIPLLGSPVDDEALNAVRALDKTLKSAGLDFHTAAVLERGAPIAHHDSKRGF